jgi:hypothetical protein
VFVLLMEEALNGVVTFLIFSLFFAFNTLKSWVLVCEINQAFDKWYWYNITDALMNIMRYILIESLIF